MGKAKAKGRRGRDDDDFECAVQALEIDTPAAQPQQADDESSELDELLERALALCLISEASYDELTDELADGTRNEAEVCDEWDDVEVGMVGRGGGLQGGPPRVPPGVPPG